LSLKRRNKAATPDLPRNEWRDPLTGTCYLHTVIDDHSRVAYVEARDDETKETATDVLRNAVAWFADRGVTVQRVCPCPSCFAGRSSPASSRSS
jgi:transposase